jgi:palmitoyltransferase
VLIASITTAFLRLYFLPAGYAVPPPAPPPAIAAFETVFQVPRPQNGEARLVTHDDLEQDNDAGGGLIVHCHAGACGGRWKPPRARHCSECGRCRLGFDHHCLFVSEVRCG